MSASRKVSHRNPLGTETSGGTVADSNGTQLRVYLRVPELQSQFAAYMATPTKARGYPPREGQHSLIVEVAPALSIQRLMDVALTTVPTIEPGLLFVERQYGILEVHSSDPEELDRAGAAILESISATAEDQLIPKTLFCDIIENISDHHAVIINRSRDASMIMPGMSLLVYEMEPALFAAIAANEAERVAPDVILVDISMIGAAGRIYLAGDTSAVVAARDGVKAALDAISARSLVRESPVALSRGLSN